METKGLISVIIPVYNVEKYLRECVESVLKQTYQNFEIILVDDGSKDSSGDICDEYAEKDTRIRVIHKENGGLSRARNAGFEEAQGEYVYFLDSDDWIEEKALEELKQCAEENAADVVFFDAISFEDESGEKCEKQTYIRNGVYPSGLGTEVFAALQNNKEFRSAVPLLFMKKSFIDEQDIRFLPDVLYEDLLYTFEVFCLASKVTQLSKTFYHRRYRFGSITQSKKHTQNYLSSDQIFREVLNFSDQHGLTDQDAVKQYIIRCAYSALNNFSELEREDKALCKEKVIGVRKLIRERKAFGSKSLYARCFGKLPWAAAKVLEKIKVF